MSATLQRKVSKVLSSRVRVDSPDMVAALKGLSTFYLSGANTSEHRRNLQSVLEKRDVRINQSLVAAFQQVKEQLEKVESTVNGLSERCEQINNQLQTARQSTAHLLESTTSLQNKKTIVESRHSIVTSFLDRFRLSDEDVEALDAEVINNDFFQALDRIAQIRHDCKKLLHSYHQRVGLDIMDSLALCLEKGYEKLYRWAQKESRNLVTVAQINPTFITAFALLKQMPVYYDHCCEEIAQARRFSLIQRFISALTQGGPNGTPRPIEMHAHEPTRYVSDMFAWVHQALAEERDFIRGLLNTVGKEEGKQSSVAIQASVPASELSSDIHIGENDNKLEEKSISKRAFSHSSDTEDSTKQLLDQIMQGLARPLKLRIEQALQTQPAPITAFKLVNIIQFYKETIRELLPESSKFSSMLKEITEASEASFEILLYKQADKVVRYPPSFTHDLSPPRMFMDTINQLTQLMQIYEKSLISTAKEEMSFAPVLASVLDPLFRAVEITSSTLDVSDACVYYINVIGAVQTALRKFSSFTQSRLETLSFTLNSYLDTLVEAQTNLLFVKVGLSNKLEKLHQSQKSPSSDPLSTVPGMDQDSIEQAVTAFYGIVFALGTLVMPQCDRILDAKLRMRSRQVVATQLASAYAEIYQAVLDSSNKYSNPSTFLRHTPDEINTLLGVNPVDSKTSKEKGLQLDQNEEKSQHK